ncbi:MAG: co-chaperone DjlA [Gammaproteobacteria bacterium]|nr:co-chaperone DjlA [Gammaproteobacteria bacterium]MDP2140999.1 co-chaperone DjlA [Gammaproteobacteria bacterium]MDP2349257.1 co-chaperone DjlA [Gammaproteobacteria bacterium]
MNWWGKVIGGTFGFMMGGPLGAVLGAALGNYFDSGMALVANDGRLGAQGTERVQTAFFTAVFSLMGYVAKADGRVSRNEISLAEQVMNQMQLRPEQRKLAISLFEQGKQDAFPYAEVIEQFRRECLRRRNLIQMFLEIVTATALADGRMDPAERRVLEAIATTLGYPQSDYDRLVMRMSAQFRFNSGESPADRLFEAYKVLGVTKDTPTDDIKKAYRKLMSQHHPDKLVSKGLPEEMTEIATRKTQEIKSAYEFIMERRG